MIIAEEKNIINKKIYIYGKKDIRKLGIGNGVPVSASMDNLPVKAGLF